MNYQVFSPLHISQCATAVMRAFPSVQIETGASIMVVKLGRHRISFTLEEWGPDGDSFGGIRSIVSVNCVESLESAQSLETPMNEEGRLAERVRFIIKALKPVEVCESDGRVIPVADLDTE